MSKGIHLGCDTGEAADTSARDRELALLRHVTMAHIACGGHAGDEESIRLAVDRAVRHGCAIGAHPSYPDKEGFGRRQITIARDELAASLRSQIESIRLIANEHGVRIGHVKPHGALYHAIAGDLEFAGWFHAITAQLIKDAALVLPIGSSAIEPLRADGVQVLVEGFCDRAYEDDGTLRSRSEAGALIEDPDTAADQGARLVREHGCDLLCVHSDTAGAVSIASAVSARLRAICGD